MCELYCWLLFRAVIKSCYEAFTWTVCVINWTNSCLVLFHSLCVCTVQGPRPEETTNTSAFYPLPRSHSLSSAHLSTFVSVCERVCVCRVGRGDCQTVGRQVCKQSSNTHTHTHTHTSLSRSVLFALSLTYAHVPGLSRPKQKTYYLSSDHCLKVSIASFWKSVLHFTVSCIKKGNKFLGFYSSMAVLF